MPPQAPVATSGRSRRPRLRAAFEASSICIAAHPSVSPHVLRRFVHGLRTSVLGRDRTVRKTCRRVGRPARDNRRSRVSPFPPSRRAVGLVVCRRVDREIDDRREAGGLRGKEQRRRSMSNKVDCALAPVKARHAPASIGNAHEVEARRAQTVVRSASVGIGAARIEGRPSVIRARCGILARQAEPGPCVDPAPQLRRRRGGLIPAHATMRCGKGRRRPSRRIVRRSGRRRRSPSRARASRRSM